MNTILALQQNLQGKYEVIEDEQLVEETLQLRTALAVLRDATERKIEFAERDR